MPRCSTFPTLYDECKTVSIAFLTQHGYLFRNQCKSGSIEWSINGAKTGSISIRVNTNLVNPYLELDYKCNQTPINYRVGLISLPSNLGRGVVWYFVCPRTGKRARKLYLADTYFYHRSAFRGCMYNKQTQSKKYKNLDKTFGLYFQSDQLYEQLYKKHFKKKYAGKPTKKYLKIIQQLQKAETISLEEMHRALT